MMATRIGLCVNSPQLHPVKRATHPLVCAIETCELSKRFGQLQALAGLNLNIATGTIFGLVGPNGAGKSTAINCMTGLLQPTGGSIRLLGDAFTIDSTDLKRRIGVMPEGLALFDQLYADEFLRFQARMYGIDSQESGYRARELIDKLDLGFSRTRLIEFSTGMRKKVAFAAAIIHRPEILFLDEPFAGMDAGTVSMLKDWLRNFASRGGTVFLTTHILETVESFCTAAAIMKRGRRVWESPSSLPALKEGLVHQGHKFPTLEALYLEATASGKTRFEWR
jgi:ABC-2 type transport system ATP-binding protein